MLPREEMLAKKKMKECRAMAHDKGNARVGLMMASNSSQIALQNSSSH
jgi:hypothetical protein